MSLLLFPSVFILTDSTLTISNFLITFKNKRGAESVVNGHLKKWNPKNSWKKMEWEELQSETYLIPVKIPVRKGYHQLIFQGIST